MRVDEIGTKIRKERKKSGEAEDYCRLGKSWLFLGKRHHEEARNATEFGIWIYGKNSSGEFDKEGILRRRVQI
jgi:hypothetical protein